MKANAKCQKTSKTDQQIVHRLFYLYNSVNCVFTPLIIAKTPHFLICSDFIKTQLAWKLAIFPKENLPLYTCNAFVVQGDFDKYFIHFIMHDKHDTIKFGTLTSMKSKFISGPNEIR